MIASRRTRTLLLVISAALVAVGVIFFARQDLGTADQYASVASFFVGFVGVVLSLWSFLASRASRSDETAESPEESTSARSSLPGSTSGLAVTINARDIDVLQSAPKARAVVNKTVHLSAAPRTSEPDQDRDMKPVAPQPDLTTPGTDTERAAGD